MDLNRIGTLLHVIDTSRHWPRLKHIHDWAMRELEAMEMPDNLPKPVEVRNPDPVNPNIGDNVSDVRVSGDEPSLIDRRV